MLKFISFDFDGTLVNEDFDNLIWNSEIPKLYAKKHNLTLKQATFEVYADYYKALYIEKVNGWTSTTYWFKRLGLEYSNELIQDLSKKIHVYPEVPQLLDALSKKYTLVITSNTTRQFLELKMKKEHIEKYFTHVFLPTELKLISKNEKMYKLILKKLKCKPNELMHIGDNYHEDVQIPASLGIKAIHLNRTKKTKNSIQNLKQLLFILD